MGRKMMEIKTSLFINTSVIIVLGTRIVNGY
jgi:hypothetical protein